MYTYATLKVLLRDNKEVGSGTLRRPTENDDILSVARPSSVFVRAIMDAIKSPPRLPWFVSSSFCRRATISK